MMAARRRQIWPTSLICVLVWVSVASGVQWGILRSLAGSGSTCIHIKGDSTANNALLEPIKCDLGSPGQHFDVSWWGNYWQEGGGGPLVFRSGRCVTGDPRPPGTPHSGSWNATAWECFEEPHQSWRIEGSKLGAASPFQLVGSNGKCLTVEKEGGYLDHYTCDTQASAPHQWFIMEKIPGAVTLTNVKVNDKCIHIKDDSSSNGAVLDPAPCDVTIHQLVFAQDLSQYVTTAGPLQFLSGKCITGSETDTKDGFNATVSDCVDVPHQKWKIAGGVPFSAPFQVMSAGGGSVGKCLTVEKEGGYIDLWDCRPLAGYEHQWFTTQSPNRVGLLGSANAAWTGLCVHIKGDSLANYASLEMTACDPTLVGQQFDISNWGSYKIRPGRLQFLSGRCITGDWETSENGVSTVLWDCEDQAHQLFLMRSGSLFETNSFQLQSSNGLCLNPSPSDGGLSFSQWECGVDYASAPHQFFTVLTRGVVTALVAAAPPPPPPVPRCLLEHEVCNPDDVQCCDGEYCLTWRSSSWCRKCIPQGGLCAPANDFSTYVSQVCCQYLTCQPDPSNPYGQGTCQQGDCTYIVGEDCLEKTCCAGLTCSSWNGRFVCRPPPPVCAKTGDSSGGSCYACCAMRCTTSTVETMFGETGGAWGAYTTGSGATLGGCDCAGADHHCVDDSYCCAGKCGADYYCIG